MNLHFIVPFREKAASDEDEVSLDGTLTASLGERFDLLLLIAQPEIC